MKISSSLKKLFILLTLSSLSMTVMNCSKSGSDEPTSQIVGSWKITALLSKEGTKPETDEFPLLLAFVPCFKDLVFTFKNDGTATTSASKECQEDASDITGIGGTSKYELVGSKLTITEADGSKDTQEATFSGSKMTWTTSEVDKGITTTFKIVFTKQ